MVLEDDETVISHGILVKILQPDDAALILAGRSARY